MAGYKPTVTVGRATGEPVPTKAPKVTFGQAYGMSATPAGTLVIRELTGDERTITLSGRALPYKPIIFEGEQRIEEMPTAGFAATTQQPTGPQEMPSSWKGAWKTRFLSDRAEMFANVSGATSEYVDGVEEVSVSSSSIRTAAELAELFDDIRRKGQMLRVSFAHLVRIGRLSKFRQEWQTSDDVDWTMEFKWSSIEEGVITAAPVQSGLSRISQQVSAAYVGLEDATAMDGVPNLDPTLADRIDAGVGRMWRQVAELEGAITARVGAVTSPVEALRRACSSLTSLRDEAELFVAELDAQTADSMMLAADATSLVSVKAGAQVAAAVAKYRAKIAARTVKHQAARQRFATLKALDANLLAVVLCKQEQDLRVLSRIYYGTPNDAEVIRAFNAFDGYTVPTGTTVMIPVRETA